MHPHVRACLVTMNWLLSSPEHASHHHTVCDAVVCVCCGLDNTWRGFSPQNVRFGAATCRLPQTKAGTTPHPLHQIHLFSTRCITHMIQHHTYCTTHQTIQHSYFIYTMYTTQNSTTQYNTTHRCYPIDIITHHINYTLIHEIHVLYIASHNTTSNTHDHRCIYIYYTYIYIHMHVYVSSCMMYACPWWLYICMWCYFDVGPCTRADVNIPASIMYLIYVYTLLRSSYVITCLICMHVLIHALIHSVDIKLILISSSYSKLLSHISYQPMRLIQQISKIQYTHVYTRTHMYHAYHITCMSVCVACLVPLYALFAVPFCPACLALVWSL